MLPTLVGTSHGAIQFMAYEEMKILYKNQYPQMDNPVIIFLIISNIYIYVLNIWYIYLYRKY